MNRDGVSQAEILSLLDELADLRRQQMEAKRGETFASFSKRETLDYEQRQTRIAEILDSLP